MESPIGSLLHENQFQQIARCSNCSSLFIEDTSCQSCGHQFRTLGESESFYEMKDRFHYFHQKAGIYFPLLMRKRNQTAFKIYKQKLIRRAHYLLDHLQGGKSGPLPASAVSLSLLECFHILQELSDHGLSILLLFRNIEELVRKLPEEWGDLQLKRRKVDYYLLWDLLGDIEEFFLLQKQKSGKSRRQIWVMKLRENLKGPQGASWRLVIFSALLILFLVFSLESLLPLANSFALTFLFSHR